MSGCYWGMLTDFKHFVGCWVNFFFSSVRIRSLLVAVLSIMGFSCSLLIYFSSESCSFLRSSDWDNLSSSHRQDSFSGLLQHWLMVTDRVSVCLPGNVLISLSVVKDGFRVDRHSGWQAVILRAWIISFHAFLALQMSEGTSNVSFFVSWHFPL